MNTPSIGRSLQLYFVDGKPDGMLTAEMPNWSGHILVAPRTQIAEALARSQTAFTGIYLLVGDRDGEPCAYIGEAENAGKRIKDHDLKKDWWSTFVLVTSSANELNKAHVRYLEARLISEARRINRLTLENGNAPALPGLSEAECANMEIFLSHILMVLPALRIDLFLEKTRPTGNRSEPDPDELSPRFIILSKKHGIKATAIVRDGEFIVEQGSTARPEWSSSSTHSYRKLTAELHRMGVLRIDGAHAIFTENYAFGSPSAAAAVVRGRPSSGPLKWKQEGSGLSYRDWEQARTRQVEPDP